MKRNNAIIVLSLFLLSTFSITHGDNNIFAKRYFQKVDSLAKSISEDCILMSLSSDNVNSLGESRAWNFWYADIYADTMYYFSIRSDSLKLDSSKSEILTGTAFIYENWIDSDFAMAIAESRGGTEFSHNYPEYQIQLTLSKNLIWDAFLTWTIKYIDTTNIENKLELEVRANPQELEKCLSYYPLETGNKWAYAFSTGYKDFIWYKTRRDTFCREVIGDTLMPNEEKFFIIHERYKSGKLDTYSYERLDSLAGYVYQFDTVEKKEILMDDLYAFPGDTIDSYRFAEPSANAYTYTLFQKDTSFFAFNQIHGAKYYKTYDLSMDRYRLLENIGLYRHEYSFDFGNTTYQLAYSEVGGEKYGNENYYYDNGNHEKITAFEGFILVDTVAKNISNDCRMIYLSSQAVDTAGKSEFWQFCYADVAGNKMYYFSANAEFVWMDSSSNELLTGAAFVDNGWHNSDNAFHIAEFQGGREFRNSHDNFNINMILRQKLEQNSYPEWHIVYLNRDDVYDYYCTDIIADGLLFPKPQNFKLNYYYELANYFNLSWDYPDTSNTDAHLKGYLLFRNFEIIDTLNSATLSHQEIEPPVYKNNNVYYTLRAIYDEPAGFSAPTDTLFERGDAIGIDENGPCLPEKMALNPNYPNPFNPTTTITYSLNKSEHVRLEVYDLLGQLTEVLINKDQSAGHYKVQWNAGKFSSGVYFYRFIAGDFVQVKKCLLMK